MSRINIADTVKKQTDRILRQRQLSINANIVIQGNPAGDPTVTDPSADLTTHKSSSDHDGRYYTETELNAGQLDTRYYTEAEVDALVAEAGRYYEPLTDGNSNFVFYNGDVIMGEVI